MLRFIVGPVIILLGVAMCSKSISMENYAETFSFRVLLNDVEVGWHTFQLLNQGEYLNVRSTMCMDFTVLLIKKVTYRHEANEVWREGCLHRFTSTTRRDKKVISMSGALENDKFIVNDGTSDIELGKCVKSFAYWNPKWLDAKFLLNVENGKYTPVNQSNQKDPISGFMVKTLGLPKTEIYLEYDESGIWQTLESELKIAGALKYQRTKEPIGEIDEDF